MAVLKAYRERVGAEGRDHRCKVVSPASHALQKLNSATIFHKWKEQIVSSDSTLGETIQTLARIAPDYT